jgi:hypothetical protein
MRKPAERQPQLLDDLFKPSASTVSSTTGESINVVPKHTMPKLSPEAAAIIHAHLPPPNVEQYLDYIEVSKSDVAGASKKSKPELSPDRTWSVDDGLPIAIPMTQAVQGRVFGTEENGEPVVPSVEEIEAITRNVVEDLTELLPDSEQYSTQYVGLLERYSEDFGPLAAKALDEYVRAQATRDDEGAVIWGPGHPWHYYAKGDGKAPIPIVDIPPDEKAGWRFVEGLSKKFFRFPEKLAVILADQQQQLNSDQHRYTELIEKGVAALNHYDRSIAAAGDEPLAWATAISLKYTHIAAGLGRILALQCLINNSKAKS